MKLTKQQIMQIPALKKKGKTNIEIAKQFGVALRTIQYWIVSLRLAGHKVPNIKKKSIDLTN